MKEPIIQERNDFVDVEFYRVSDAETENDRMSTENDRIESDKRIIEFVNKNKSITKNNVKALLNIKDTKAKEVLNEMIEKNILQRKGAGRSTYYILATEKGANDEKI